MLREIVHIDEEKCNGCGACASACLEGAIAMIDGKARLIRDDYCDGLGACLPACPTDAITIEKREAMPFDAEAASAHIAESLLACDCPGKTTTESVPTDVMPDHPVPPHPHFVPHHGGCPSAHAHTLESPESCLGQWPVQIQLVPVKAMFFHNAKLLIAADCAAYTYAQFHQHFMRGKITLIGCPKLDDADYTAKLTAILQANDIRELTIVRMEVPCCGGIERAAKAALQASGRFIPWQVVTLSTKGEILE